MSLSLPAKTNGRKTAKWIPKKWEVEYEQMVILSTLGRSNDEIAAAFKCTPQHVSNIINTPQAAITRRRVLDELQKRVADSIPQRMEAIADKAVQRLYSVMHDDELFEKSPFAVVDRGMDVMKAIGIVRDEKKFNVEKAIILTSEQSSDLLDGLTKANKAKEINDGDFEVIEDAESDN